MHKTASVTILQNKVFKWKIKGKREAESERDTEGPERHRDNRGRQIERGEKKMSATETMKRVGKQEGTCRY